MKLRTCEIFQSRRSFIDGVDAQIIMCGDEAPLIRLWRAKRGETEPEDLSTDLIVQLRSATASLNRSWYERRTGHKVEVQRRVRHSAIPWMVATLDGMVAGRETVFSAKFMPPASFSKESALAMYQAELQHNMWVTHARSAVLSIITGDGKWVELTVPIDPLYLSLLVTAEKKFWRCVQSGEPPRLTHHMSARASACSSREVVRIVDMSRSRAWSECARLYRATHGAFLAHERAKRQPTALLPAAADQAIGHGIRALRTAGGSPRVELCSRRRDDQNPTQGPGGADSAPRTDPPITRSGSTAEPA